MTETPSCQKQEADDVAHSEQTMRVDFLADLQTVRVPFGNSFVRVGYVDVGPRDGPVCVTVHGAPGGIKDILELATPLSNAGIRLIIPEFPGYGNTVLDDDAIFNQSTEARVELVKKFLYAIDISRVAAVAGHSMGTATAIGLAANSDMFQSVISLSGIGLEPHRALRPYWMMQWVSSLLENSWTSSVMSWMLAYGYKYQGFKLETGEISTESLKIGMISAAKIGFDQVCENVDNLREKRLPLLFAMTKSDRLVEWQLPVAMAKRCGTEDTHFTFFDAEEKVTDGPSPDDVTVGYPRALVFERGGHYVHRSHLDVVATSVINLIKFVIETTGA